VAPGDDETALARLFEAAQGFPPPEDYEPFVDPTTGTAVQLGARSGRQALSRALAGMDLYGVAAACSLTLVAEASPGEIVGLALTCPPVALAAEMASAGNTGALPGLLLGAAKIAALAVDPDHQRQGIGHDLLATTRATYARAGWSLLLGEVDSRDDGLSDFYRSAGMEVFDVDDAIDLSPLAGFALHLATETRGERYVLRTLRSYPVQARVREGARQLRSTPLSST
jgi:GNAT superfamily N-acetyltransferase